MSSTEELLNGTTQEPVPETLEQEIQEEAPKVDDGEPTAPESEPVPEQPKEPTMVPLAAVQDERTKRQESEKLRMEAEARARVLEQQLQLQNAPTPKQPDPVDYYEDPAGFTQQQIQQFAQQQRDQQIAGFREMAKVQWSDYEEKEALFMQAAQTNPNLSQQALNSPNPASFAYQYITQQQEVQQYSDPNYKEKLKAEILAEMEAEKLAQSKAEAANRAGIPPSIAGQRSAQQGQQLPFRQPTTEELFS